jgi:hypothetical protein
VYSEALATEFHADLRVQIPPVAVARMTRTLTSSSTFVVQPTVRDSGAETSDLNAVIRRGSHR